MRQVRIAPLHPAAPASATRPPLPEKDRPVLAAAILLLRRARHRRPLDINLLQNERAPKPRARQFVDMVKEFSE